MEFGGYHVGAAGLHIWRIQFPADSGRDEYNDVEEIFRQGKEPGGAVLAAVWSADYDQHWMRFLKCTAAHPLATGNVATDLKASAPESPKGGPESRLWAAAAGRRQEPE